MKRPADTMSGTLTVTILATQVVMIIDQEATTVLTDCIVMMIEEVTIEEVTTALVTMTIEEITTALVTMTIEEVAISIVKVYLI